MAKKNSLLEINTVLNDYTKIVYQEADEAAKEAAEEAKNYLRQNSPAKTGAYAKGWRVDKHNGAYVVHNKTNYQLTHLLENGHDVVAYGKKVGRTKAQPHIKEAEELAIKAFEDKLTEKIET